MNLTECISTPTRLFLWRRWVQTQRSLSSLPRHRTDSSNECDASTTDFEPLVLAVVELAVATVFTGQRNDRFGQGIFVDPRDRGIALCPSPLP